MVFSERGVDICSHVDAGETQTDIQTPTTL